MLVRTIAVLAVLATAVAAPATATAKGGGTDPGATPSPTPTPTSAPCASIAVNRATESLNIAGKTDWSMKLNATITSCSSASQTFTVQVSDDAYANLGGGDCSIPTFIAGPYTVGPGERRSFSFSTPQPPYGICTHWFTETLVAADGTVLGSVVQRYNSTSRI